MTAKHLFQRSVASPRIIIYFYKSKYTDFDFDLDRIKQNGLISEQQFDQWRLYNQIMFEFYSH